MSKVQVYTKKNSPRLEYACDILFAQIIKCTYTIETDIDQLNFTENKIINYSEDKIDNSLQVVPFGLLEQKGIAEQSVLTGNFEKLGTFFHNGIGDLPFDLFSAVFYLASRYEEYLPYEGDLHGRFTSKNSILSKINSVDKPLIELWAKLLADKLNIAYPIDTYKFLLTIDIDQAWKYKNKGFFITCGGLLKDLIRGNVTLFKERLSVLSGKKIDPAFTFDYLNDIERKISSPIQYFILVGRHRKYDRAVSIKRKEYKKLLAKFEKKNKLGIHPSYKSNESLEISHNEYYALSYAIKNKILRSRQHYLIMKFPDTFRNLIELGIREEFSMGWSDCVGFRAGISRPFPFYDLPKEKQTHLMLVPFVAMDRTLQQYMKRTTEEGMQELKRLADTIISVGGQFTLLWHNDNLTNIGEWEGWNTVFEGIVEYAGEISG